MQRLRRILVESVLLLASGIVLFDLAGMQNRQERREGGKAMTETFYSSSLDNPIAPARPAVRIHLNGGAPAPAEAAAGQAFVIRAFVNDEMNSRIGVNIAPGAWAETWATELPATFQTEALMTEGTRIALQGRSDWRLLSIDGNTIGQGGLGPGNIVLDPANRRMYLPSQESRVMARNLEDAQPVLMLMGYFGDGFRRAFLAPRGSGIVLVSVERMLRSKRPVKPDLTVVERYDLGTPMEIGVKNVVKSATRTANLLRQTADFKAAMHGDTLVMAVPNAVYFADSDLHIQSEMTGEFEALAMSLDELLNVYLFVRTNDGTLLWAITPRGELRFAFPLRAGENIVGTPPIVGYDHSVYLLTSTRVICLDAGGKLRWEHPGASSGAVVTPAHQLLAAEGPEVALYARDGNRSVIHRVGRGVLATAPVALSNGVIAATRDRCYRLQPGH